MGNVASKITLSPRKAGAAIGGHPWVFAGMIGRVEGEPADGDPVEVYGGDTGKFIAHGLYNSKSEIRVRLYSWKREVPPDEAFFKTKIARAAELRGEIPGFSGACRLVFSEADGLSGLTVDRYGPYLVMQVTSLALFLRIEMLADIFMELFRPKGIYLKAVKEISKKEGMEFPDRVLRGEVPEEPAAIESGGLRYEVELRGGQKTGFYLDQAENREVAARLSKGKSVLDLYCYTGGFSLACAKAGASEVTGVDSSAAAIARAERNARLNSVDVKFVESDAMDYLRESPEGKFDVVIVDPPRLVSARESKERALRMYHRINSEALKALKPGGTFISCSCSGAVTNEDWLSLLASVGRRAGRFFQLIELRGAGRDHPVSLHCPETRYLKCAISRILE